MVREALGYAQKRMAEASGSKFRSWQDYEADRKTPGSQVIAGLVRLGINANWVLIGEGPMMLAELQAPAPAPAATEAGHDPDLDLLEGIVATVRQALMDIETELPPEDEGKVIRLLYQLGLERHGKLDKKTVAEVIRLVA